MTNSKRMHATPEDVEQAFYDALERADLEGLMDVWSEDDEIVCIHPGGPRLIGHEAVRAAWKALFAHGPVNVRPLQIHVVTQSMSAVHTVLEQVVVGDVSASRIANVFATNVYFKGPQGWRLVAHHASLTAEAPVGPQSGLPTILH